MDFDIHSILQLLGLAIGLAVCVCSSIDLIFKGHKKIGAIFLERFLLILQTNLYIQIIGLDSNHGVCWAEHGGFYQCQPPIEKL